MAARLSTVSKEGFLYKKGGIIKSWSRRYFVLNPQSLCYFRSESHDKLEPLGRIFLSDIVSISTESTEKKKAFVFVLHTKKRAVLLQGANNEDRDKWVASIKKASEIDEEAEKQDPFRKSLRRLTPGVKRITLFKDPTRGIGCTIKNSAGHIFVNRIIEDGPIAETGILRPGDEILEIHGVPVTNKAVPEVVDIIKHCPTEFLATVRPITSVHKQKPFPNSSRVDYSSIVHKPGNNRYNGGHHPSPPSKNGVKSHFYELDSSDGTTTSSDESVEYATVTKKHNGRHFESPIDDPPVPPRSTTPLTPPSFESQPSFEDVGNYDDEDEGDVPPPLPDWTEDALILVDPPPVPPRPDLKFNIYNTNAHLMPRKANPSSSPSTPQHSPYPKRKKKLSQDELISYSPRNGSPVPPSRHSPPNFPPPRPGKLLKSYSQDALDHIGIGESKPPVPPRLKRHEQCHYSPEPKPRRMNALPRRVQLHDKVEVISGGKSNVKYADLHFAQDCVVGNGGRY